MIYDLRKPFDVERYKTRSAFLLEKQRVVELKEKTGRSLKQNSYLFLILNIFALDYGCTVEFVKQEFFKKLVNPDIFIIKKNDKILGEIEILKSSADITKEEMVTAIDRFKVWSNNEAGIFLPDSLSFDERIQLEQLIERNRNYL